MTKDQIAQWASEAEAHANTLFDWVTQEEEWHAARNERFAELVAAAEREACAQVCLTHSTAWLNDVGSIGDYDPQYMLHGALAAAIRARGTP